MNNALISSFWEAGWFGRFILIILFILSIYAWAVIAMKWRMLKEIHSQKDKFLKQLNQNQDNLLALYEKKNSIPNALFQNLYEIICEELDNILHLNSKSERTRGITPVNFNRLQELSDCTISNQIISVEKYLIVLATTASISPLLGLLGTVWGVLISFRGMASLGTASLSVIAPGISEALVTTVTGLLVAIPALVGYNVIANKIYILTRELDNFSSRLLSYIQSVYYTSRPYEKESVYSA